MTTRPPVTKGAVRGHYRGNHGVGAMIRKIVSGGQTGADRAALDEALRAGVPHGGWVPRGRKAEDGPIPRRYRLKETPTGRYADRTERNVREGDGTLIVSRGALTGGSLLTQGLARKHRRPCLHVDLGGERNVLEEARAVRAWTLKHGIEVLNVAGPRASNDSRIYDLTRALLRAVISSEREREPIDSGEG